MVPSREKQGLAITGLVIAALAGCAGGEEPRPADTHVARFDLADLHTCERRPKIYGFLCGEIEVPFERADNSYGTTEIGFAYRERGDRSKPSLGPIFAVEGGPGYSSSGTASAYRHLLGPLLRRHELVLVDMRGTGHSGPIDCPDVQQNRAPEWIAVSDCAARLGKRFVSYRTSAAADDINDVRRALGYETIALYGDSYGTFLGQSYAYRHGETLDALVLDGAYPAFGEDPWYPSLIRTGNRALAIACERSPRCEGDARARLRQAVDHLRERHISVGPLIDAIQGGAYGPPHAYLVIDAVLRRMLSGNRSSYDRLTTGPEAGFHRILKYNRPSELVVGCNDYPMIWDRDASEPERRRQLEQAIREYDPKAFPPFTPREVALSAEVGYLECLTWPPPSDVYEPAVDPDTDEPTKAPVLVVSGELDDLTTAWEGRQVAKEFPDSRLYVAPNAGHVNSLYYTNGAAAQEIREFLAREIGG